MKDMVKKFKSPYVVVHVHDEVQAVAELRETGIVVQFRGIDNKIFTAFRTYNFVKELSNQDYEIVNPIKYLHLEIFISVNEKGVRLYVVDPVKDGLIINSKFRPFKHMRK